MFRRSPWHRRAMGAVLVALCACRSSSGEDAPPQGSAETDGACTTCSGAQGDASLPPSDGDVDSPDGSSPAVDASAGSDASAAHDGATSSDDGGSSPLGPGACPTLTSGWSRYYPTTTIQYQNAGANNEYCTYWNDGGVESFRLDKNPSLVIQRCEARVNNDYRTGKNEFEGDVFVTEADNMCLHQVFNFLMLVAYPQDGGELHQHSGTLLESGVFGRWVHVNTIHDTTTDTAHIYLDCQHVYDMADSPPPSDAGWYDKYGLYGIQGEPPAEQTSIVRWTNVAYYRQP